MGDLSGKMNAFEIERGRLLWSTQENAAIRGRPIIFKDFIIYGTVYGRILARNKNNGNLVYAVDVGAPFEATPTVYKGRLFLHLRNHSIVAMDAMSGKILWNYKRAIPFLTTLQKVSIPRPYKERIIVGFADGFVASLSIHDGTISWERKISQGAKFIDVDLNPRLIKGKIWVGTSENSLHILDPQTGSIDNKLKYRLTVAPIEFEGRIYLGTANGELVVLDENRLELYRRVISTMSGVSSIAITKEHIAVTDYLGHLKIMLLKGFVPVYDFSYGSEHSSVFGDISFYQNYLAVATSRNRLYIYKRR
jgi:outer membrane protein assembly factor BamB